MFRELCGEKTLKNVVLVTNMWGRVTPEDGESREQQLRDKYFRAAIGKGAQLCRHTNTPKSAWEILRKILENKPVVLKIQEELIDEHKDIGQTRAGAELKREMLQAEERHKREIKELEMNMQKAAKEKDEETRRECEEEKRRLEREREKLRKDSEEMKSKFEKARRKMEERMNARIKALQEEHAKEIARLKKEKKDAVWLGISLAVSALALLVFKVRVPR